MTKPSVLNYKQEYVQRIGGKFNEGKFVLGIEPQKCYLWCLGRFLKEVFA